MSVDSSDQPPTAGSRAGRRTIFLAGGPGLSASYASALLTRSNFAKNWRYFEQPGCDGVEAHEPVTAQAVAEAARAFVEEQAADGPVSLVAHSWGAWLALGLLRRLQVDRFVRVVLLHPAPPTKAGLDEAVGSLFARLRPEAMAQIGPLMTRTDLAAGREAMQALLPAYCGRETDLPDLDLQLHPLVFHGVNATLGDFDQRPVLAAHRDRITLVFGEDDYITPELYARHAGPLEAFDVATLKGGHFGFLEDPGFAALLAQRGL